MAVIVMQRPDLHLTLPAIILIFAIQSCANVDPGATGEPAQLFVSFVSSSSSLDSPNPQGGISRRSDVEALRCALRHEKSASSLRGGSKLKRSRARRERRSTHSHTYRVC